MTDQPCRSMITIKVVTNAKKREIIPGGPELKVKLTSLPIDGRANEELIELLSVFFGLKKSDIQIVRGQKDKRKVIALAIDRTTLISFLKTAQRVTTR